MHTGVTADLPFLCYGYNGVNSLVELVMVNRRVPGNRKVVASFSSYRRVMRQADRNVNVGSDCEGGFGLEMHVSTCSRSQYALLGKLVHGDESHFFNLSQRTASVSHAEAKHYSSREVDSLLQQSTAGIPAIPAGGARDFFIRCPIELLASEALQIQLQPDEDM